MERRWLNSVSVTVGDDGLLNSGPLATEAKQDGIIAALAPAAIGGYSAKTVVKLCIDQSAAGYTTLFNPATKAGVKSYLMRLKGTMSVGGTLGIYSADDAAGTGKVALYGPVNILAGGGPHAEDEDDPAMALEAPANKFLLLLTTTGKFAGRAVVAY